MISIIQKCDVVWFNVSTRTAVFGTQRWVDNNDEEEIKQLDLNTLTPIEALMKLNEIKKMVYSDPKLVIPKTKLFFRNFGHYNIW